MNTGLAFIILGEVALFLFIVYGLLHEDRFIAFEDKMIEAMRHNREVKRRARETARLRKINKKVLYTPVRPAHRSADDNNVA